MKKKKYTKEELFAMDAVEVYKLVLEGKYVKIFPAGFWQRPEAEENAAKCLKYLIEDILQLTDEEIKEQFSRKFLTENKLSGIVNRCFRGNLFKSLENAYPGKFVEWELNLLPNNFWDKDENVVRAIKWLVEEKMQFSDEQLKEQLTGKLFVEYGLGTLLRKRCNLNVYNAIEFAYPGKFKEWEFRYPGQYFWHNKENRVKATRWLIEEKLKLTDEQLKEQLSVNLFIENRLSGLLAKYNTSPYNAINEAYPGKFKEWEFCFVPKNFWQTKENGIKATRWLIEEKLKLTDEQLKEQLSGDLFVENGLGGMLTNCYKDSPFRAINSAYPGKFFEWEFKAVPKGFWQTKENAVKATRWLIEEKLKLKRNEIQGKYFNNEFLKHGLSGMLIVCYDGNVREAIMDAYPEVTY